MVRLLDQGTAIGLTVVVLGKMTCLRKKWDDSAGGLLKRGVLAPPDGWRSGPQICLTWAHLRAGKFRPKGRNFLGHFLGLMTESAGSHFKEDLDGHF